MAGHNFDPHTQRCVDCGVTLADAVNGAPVASDITLALEPIGPPGIPEKLERLRALGREFWAEVFAPALHAERGAAD